MKNNFNTANWPDINYTNTTIPFEDGIGPLFRLIQKRVEGFNSHLLDGVNTLEELYEKINDTIDEYVKKSEKDKETYPIENIFHMIQIWGGKTGRNIYVMGKKDKEGKDLGKGFEAHWDKYKYKSIIDKCLEIKYDEKNEIQEEALQGLIDVLRDNHISQLGTAFVTKHVRFWTYPNLKNNALPIFDSVINENLYGKEGSPQLNALLTYWKHMIAKAKEKGIELVPLERQLFKYFQEHSTNNTNKNKPGKDIFKKYQSFCKNVLTKCNSKDYIVYGNKQYGLRTNIFGNTFKYRGETAYQSFSIIGYKNAKNKDNIKKALDIEFAKELSKTVDYKEVNDFLVIYNYNPKCLKSGKLNEEELIRWFNAHAKNLVKIINENK